MRLSILTRRFQGGWLRFRGLGGSIVCLLFDIAANRRPSYVAICRPRQSSDQACEYPKSRPQYKCMSTILLSPPKSGPPPYPGARPYLERYAFRGFHHRYRSYSLPRTRGPMGCAENRGIRTLRAFGYGLPAPTFYAPHPTI